MKVAIRTKNNAVLSAFERKVIRQAAICYGEVLMSKRINDNLDIRINVVDRYYKDYGFMGDTMPLDEDEKYRPKTFEINLERTKRLKTIVFTLAHEFIHVKQFAKGELKDHKKSNKVIFHKMKFDDDNYWDSPWEIEAYGKECGLWQRFKPIYKYLHTENRKG
jgi:hypothetical protein